MKKTLQENISLLESLTALSDLEPAGPVKDRFAAAQKKLQVHVLDDIDRQVESVITSPP